MWLVAKNVSSERIYSFVSVVAISKGFAKKKKKGQVSHSWLVSSASDGVRKLLIDSSFFFLVRLLVPLCALMTRVWGS